MLRSLINFVKIFLQLIDIELMDLRQQKYLAVFGLMQHLFGNLLIEIHQLLKNQITDNH